MATKSTFWLDSFFWVVATAMDLLCILVKWSASQSYGLAVYICYILASFVDIVANVPRMILSHCCAS